MRALGAEVAPTTNEGDGRRAPVPCGRRMERQLIRQSTDDDEHASAEPTTTPPLNPTTSFLTATTLIYAIGAGITAAAGT